MQINPAYIPGVTGKFAGGNQFTNANPNANLTLAELQAFVNESADNTISFCVYRNPTTMYQFIRQNYNKMEFPNLARGMEVTGPTIQSMFSFLLNKYNALSPAQQPHFLANLIDSLPDAAQVQNWTTPKYL